MKNINRLRVAIVMMLLLVGGLAGCADYGTKLDFKDTEVYYTKNVTEAEAKKFGEYLIKEDMASGKKSSIQLDKSGSNYQVRMVIDPAKVNDPDTQAAFKSLAGQFSDEVFNKAATEVHLCDDSFKTVKVVTR